MRCCIHFHLRLVFAFATLLEFSMHGYNTKTPNTSHRKISKKKYRFGSEQILNPKKYRKIPPEGLVHKRCFSHLFRYPWLFDGFQRLHLHKAPSPNAQVRTCPQQKLQAHSLHIIQNLTKLQVPFETFWTKSLEKSCLKVARTFDGSKTACLHTYRCWLILFPF